MKAPNGLDKLKAANHAEHIVVSLQTSYWVETERAGAGELHDGEAISRLHDLAKYFGCKLVPIDAPEAVEVEMRGEVT